MSAGQVEIERKYGAASDVTLPSLLGAGPVAAQDDPEEFALDAVYYDTAELTLAMQRVAVRRREGGHDAGWHIKWPPGEEGRTEQQFPLGDPGAVPAEVREALATVLGEGELRPVARVRNRRIATVLRAADGRALVELADDHVIATDLRDGVERRWQEWEAELLDGAGTTREERTAVLDAVETVLVAAGARRLGGSKLSRALGLSRLDEEQ